MAWFKDKSRSDPEVITTTTNNNHLIILIIISPFLVRSNAIDRWLRCPCWCLLHFVWGLSSSFVGGLDVEGSSRTNGHGRVHSPHPSHSTEQSTTRMYGAAGYGVRNAQPAKSILVRSQIGGRDQVIHLFILLFLFCFLCYLALFFCVSLLIVTLPSLMSSFKRKRHTHKKGIFFSFFESWEPP
jgi:hypothetical protein